MRLFALCSGVLLTVFLSARTHAQTAAQSPPQTLPQAGGIQGEGARFRLIRSISGSKGSPQGGRFAMEDPRSVFYVPDDKQVIVYMEWEGPTGTHHIEGFWKNPAGRVSALSDFQYDARYKLFGAFWTLALSDTMQFGTWTLEARVDGELAGSHSFQILLGARPADAIPPRRMLKLAELYDRAAKSTVEIAKYGREGELLGQASGTLVSPGYVLTAFEAIDGASKLRVLFADGKGVETDQVVSWNRRQDWAVLKADLGGRPLLALAAPDSWNVGDFASFLEKAPGGNRVVVDVSIDGKSNSAIAGPRLNLSKAPSRVAVGAALVNEYGDVIGVVGGSLIPGASGLDSLDLADSPPGAVGAGSLIGGLAVPISSVSFPAAEVAQTSFETLRSKGEFLPPITASPKVGFGQLSRGVENKGGLDYPVTTANVFSHHEPDLAIYVMWEPHEKCKCTISARIYDLDNRLLSDSASVKPLKIDLRPGKRSVTFWKTNVAAMPPGIYRVDVLLNDVPAWRSFFHVTE